MQKSETLGLVGFSYSDWECCLDDMRNTGGYNIYFGETLVSRSAGKQMKVARSSAEAENKDLALASTEVLWLQSLLQELHIKMSHVPLLLCANMSTKHLASNTIMHACMKHVELDFHFLNDFVVSEKLDVKFTPLEDQLANILTKPLTEPRFASLKPKLLVLPSPSV